MKLEVEIEDGIYEAMKKMAGGNFDFAKFLSAVCQQSVLFVLTHPDEARAAYDVEAEEKLPESARNFIRKYAWVIIRKTSLITSRKPKILKD